MVDLITLILGILTIVVLLAISAFFSSSEIAIFSMERHRIDALAESGDSRAWTIKRLREDPHQLLVTVLVGNNVANIAVASIATILLVFFVPPGEAVMFGTIITSVFVLLFGEIAPKSYGVGHAESWSLTVSKPILYSQIAMRPFVFGFELVTNAINHITGGSSGFESYITRDELEGLIQTGTDVGALAATEGEMIRGVFELGRLPVTAIMIPKVDVPNVSADASLEEAKSKCIESNSVRLAVYRADSEEIGGVLDLRDIVAGLERKQSIMDVMTPPVYLPESKPIDEALTEMQSARVRMGVVIDEFGSVAGVITVEDIVEEIVGEILDRGEIQPIETRPDGTIIAAGRTTIKDINDHLGTDIPETDGYNTLAGFMYAEEGRILSEDETIEYDGLYLTAERVDNKRITRVRIEQRPEDPEE